MNIDSSGKTVNSDQSNNDKSRTYPTLEEADNMALATATVVVASLAVA